MSTEVGGKRLELIRGLGPWASAAIVVGTMIGTGIFLKPAEMAREGRFVSVVFAAWIVGALLSMLALSPMPSWARRFPKQAANTRICGAPSGQRGDFFLGGCIRLSVGLLRWLRLPRELRDS